MRNQVDRRIMLFMVTTTKQIMDQAKTIPAQALCLNGDSYGELSSKCKLLNLARARRTKEAGTMYWMKAPAYDPVRPTKNWMSLVHKAMMAGIMRTTVGNNNFSISFCFKLSLMPFLLRLNIWSRLLRSVMPMMGKLVLIVKTGKRARKYWRMG